MTNDQMKEAIIRDLFERSRTGDNQASGTLLGYFQQEEQIKAANEYAVKKTAEIMAKMTGEKTDSKPAYDMAERMKELGIDA